MNEAFLAGGGETGRLIAEFNWAQTSIGPLSQWPQSLKSATALMLRSPVPIVMLWGEDGVMLYNDSYSLFAGGRHPQLLGSKVREGWPEVADFNDNVMKVGLAGGTLHYTDQELTLWRHGQAETVVMNLDYSPLVDDSGQPAGVICIVAETTVRVATQMRLVEESALRLAERDRLWNLSQDMLARADFSGMMSSVSPAWGRVLGWSEAELLTRPYASFMHEDDMPPTIAAIGVMAESRMPTRFENRIATKDGGWKNIEWTVAPEADGVNFIAVGRDVSETRAREAELAAAQDALRQSQKMEAMGQLTGGVAHDFNNLLMPIIGSLDMLLRREIGTERERRMIDGALQSAERAKVLVQRLLAFARRQPLQSSPIDLKTLVGNMAGLVASTSGPRVEVRAQIADNLPPAQADPNQLEMAILNLAVNARDAMPEGGVLTLSATAQTVRPGERPQLTPGDYVRLVIADTGVGMDEATRLRAIEPFFSTKGIGKGTGLGLSMVHGLTLQLGGGLSIESRPGEGTTISLWLPVSTEGPATETRADDGLAARPVVGTALLVDDEELVRMTTADMLNNLGFEVVEAGSAEEALKLLDGGLKPTLLVTDHLMPGLTGAELARQVRAKTPELPILIVSGYAEADGLAPDVAALTKPFRNAELAAKLVTLGALGGE